MGDFYINVLTIDFHKPLSDVLNILASNKLVIAFNQ